MKDSKGQSYDGWTIAWDIAPTNEEYVSVYWLEGTRKACIDKFMEMYPNKTWQQVRRQRGTPRCVKARVTRV